MNPEALQYSFDLFSKDGYNGSIEDYKNLISTDSEALDYSFSLFENEELVYTAAITSGPK